MNVTAKEAVRLIEAYLHDQGLSFSHVTAKEIEVTPGVGVISVKVAGWRPNTAWAQIREIANRGGFLVRC